MSEHTDSSAGVSLPSAADLDTRDIAPHSGALVRLYLDPERRRVVRDVVYGAGVPVPAWHGRWDRIGNIPLDAVGQTVLTALELILPALEARCAEYLGAEWDGSNVVGRWAKERDRSVLDAWERAVAGTVVTAWDAGEWLGDMTWARLCSDAGVDAGASIDAVCDAVDELASADGVYLARTRGAVQAIHDARALDDASHAADDDLPF